MYIALDSSLCATHKHSVPIRLIYSLQRYLTPFERLTIRIRFYKYVYNNAF